MTAQKCAFFKMSFAKKNENRQEHNGGNFELQATSSIPLSISQLKVSQKLENLFIIKFIINKLISKFIYLANLEIYRRDLLLFFESISKIGNFIYY